jgi:hypothetical protein
MMSDLRIAAFERKADAGAGKLGESLRSRHFRVLIGASLTLTLVLGGAFVSVDRLHSKPSDSLDHPALPVGDEESKEQVVEPARQIVRLTGMQTASAGYSFMSCKNRDDPPYRGAIFLTFGLPASERADTYFETIASALDTHGWAEGPPPNDHAFAHIFSREAVTVTVYRDSDDPGVGVARLYGQCRNMNDHRNDSGWVDVTGEVTGPR